MNPEKEQQERLRSQKEALRSGNRIAVLTTLKEIRIQGHVSILPELFDLLMEQEDPQILLETRTLLNDLKDQQAASILAGAVINPEYKEIVHILASACWQNGLLYGAYLDHFVKAAILGDYATAIEAFTVIEGCIGEVEKEQRERSLDTIKSHLPEADEQKRPLLLELVKVIADY